MAYRTTANCIRFQPHRMGHSSRSESLTSLASWLGVRPEELEWFADLKVWSAEEKTSRKLRPTITTGSQKGPAAFASIESPKPRLKSELQHRILTLLLDEIPLSSLPCMASAKVTPSRHLQAPHVGQRVVLAHGSEELLSLNLSRESSGSLFGTASYPEPVGDPVGRSLYKHTPRDVWSNLAFDIDPVQLRETRSFLRRNRIYQQGAPTSPALANLCSYRWTAAWRLRNALGSYTLIRSDLAFSGNERV